MRKAAPIAPATGNDQFPRQTATLNTDRLAQPSGIRHCVPMPESGHTQSVELRMNPPTAVHASITRCRSPLRQAGVQVASRPGFLACLAWLLVAPVGCSSIIWETDLETGMARAQREGRRALVQFHTLANPDCTAMEHEVFADEEVQKLMARFVPIRLDAVLNQKLAQQFNVEVVPAFLIVRPDRQLAGIYSGRMSAEKFRLFLIRHGYN